MQRERMTPDKAKWHIANDAAINWVHGKGLDGDDVLVLELRPGTAREANALASLEK